MYLAGARLLRTVQQTSLDLLKTSSANFHLHIKKKTCMNVPMSEVQVLKLKNVRPLKSKENNTNIMVKFKDLSKHNLMKLMAKNNYFQSPL